MARDRCADGIAEPASVSRECLGLISILAAPSSCTTTMVGGKCPARPPRTVYSPWQPTGPLGRRESGAAPPPGGRPQSPKATSDYVGPRAGRRLPPPEKSNGRHSHQMHRVDRTGAALGDPAMDRDACRGGEGQSRGNTLQALYCTVLYCTVLGRLV
ncbi:hypothetical protein CALCODRAFT_355589 [Calocera cornea HHB12733]|uniref:Uncharacterized protein n=1 Tax=Calocera cornea HHB12733 TaxID=1353952 RepID=A0A165EPV1_9BASI|nr:hypothetical protein CALCODRAFT_355589 [Calocera cornea HHB12733]